MDTRRALPRGAAVLALAVSIVGSTALTPTVSAAPTDTVTDFHSVAAKKKDSQKHDDNDNQSSESEAQSSESKGGGGLSDLPIIGDVVGSVGDASPEQVISTAVQFASFAADTAVPLIRGLIK